MKANGSSSWFVDEGSGGLFGWIGGEVSGKPRPFIVAPNYLLMRNILKGTWGVLEGGGVLGFRVEVAGSRAWGSVGGLRVRKASV